MGSAAKTLLWACWFLLDSGARSVSLPDITDQKFIDECVKEHNVARASVSPAAGDMLYMTWDEGLAVVARAWARMCEFKHNPRPVHATFSSVGENLWAGSSSSHFGATAAIKRWVDEKQDYDHGANTCTAVCGHYTQVVWAGSYKVGCAAQSCPNGVKHTGFPPTDGAVLVCNYAPAGNVNGRRPYQQRAAGCTACNGTCVDNLCRNAERDSPKGGSRTSTSAVTVVVVRPVALVFTFITAYAVHHFYPQVFCYE